MKNILIFLMVNSCFLAFAQRNKIATMEPIYTSGYYVSLKGDTIRGKIQVNPPAADDFYKQFYFKDIRAKKPKLFVPKRVLAYGFDNKDFVMVNLDRKKVFVERLATGRLRFYELKYSEKADLSASLESVYYIKDTQAEEDELKQLNKLSTKYYKKNLKSFMKDQPAIWADLDKYNFNEQTVVSAVNEFNSFYDLGNTSN